MSVNGFNEKDYTSIENNSSNKVKNFLNDLRDLLNKHDVKLYGEGCEVYIKSLGYIGYLEDNIQTVEIIEGEETLYSSYKCLD
jgi:hypothetical protein